MHHFWSLPISVFLKNSLRKFFLISMIAALPLQAEESATKTVLQDMQRVADWQHEHPTAAADLTWRSAPYATALLEFYQLTNEAKYSDELQNFIQSLGSLPEPEAAIALLEASLASDATRLNARLGILGKLIESPPDAPQTTVGGSYHWASSDALFQAAAAARLSKVSGDAKFLKWADREWWTTTDVLYDANEHLYYQDNSFIGKRTKTGKKVISASANAWALGGLSQMLDALPAKDPARLKYLGLYQEMASSLLALQTADGQWHTNLLDEASPSSGQPLVLYALAWGVNRQLLPAASYQPAILKGYPAIAQLTKESPIDPAGCYLLASAEIVRLLDPTKRVKNTFAGVTLPSRFLPTTPRAFARFITERADDFAWENDLVAFRTYGPALRAAPEDSGIDCWLKRVPYPIIDKWYLQDRVKLPPADRGKSYHQDHGEGYDPYHVGSTRGCGGISAWVDGKLADSDTFVAQRIITNTPERVTFELDYSSDLGGKKLNETKRITLAMGQRLYQCDSHFTLDGKPAARLDVAIGLHPQVKGTQPVSPPDSGVIQLWETLEGLGLGTAIVIDPARVLKVISQDQTLCLAQTDTAGNIRWFAGYGWEGQGEITSAEKWADYLTGFTKQARLK